MNPASSTDGFADTGAELQKPKFPKLLLIASILFVATFTGAGSWWYFGRDLPPSPPIRISRATTYIIEPVKPNGDIDLEKYLNHNSSE